VSGIPHLSAEQDREASTDAGDDERHDQDNGDELGVHHCNCPHMLPASQTNVTPRDIFVPTPIEPSQTVLSAGLTRSPYGAHL
jgi:hypothetical protein